ncbi:MAG: Vacuole effluxer Atg22 like protein [Chloroflexi bacterium ADurb.Bin360]|nr:MAG: Vacuole effluxer Atg22 like protein [Chloroflexi bacterium ADurb.Bin360]
MNVKSAAELQYRKMVNAWCMYDWGSSAFSTTAEAAVLPVYFGTIAASSLAPNQATAYWGYTNSLALLVAAVLAPILGSIADYTGSKKKLLAIFAGIGILATALMFTLNTGAWVFALVLFFFGSIGLGASYIFYDALLGHVAKEEDSDFVSSKGYAMGYLGGGILLAINIAMIWFLETNNLGYRLSLLSVALWWGVFTIPLMRHVPEPPANKTGIQAGLNPVKASFSRLAMTFKEIRKYRELFKFLIAFWLYNDGIGTIIKMATIYGAEIGIGTLDLVGALLLTQFVGIPFSLLFGKFSKRVGTKRSVMIGLGWYALLTVAGYFMSEAWHFWALAFSVGMVQGGTQALSRSLYSQMAPKARSAEFFGFYDVSSKFAGIIGPFLFAVVSQIAGQSRLSIVALIVFFIGGIILLTRVDEAEGIRVATVENARAARLEAETLAS